MSIKTINVLGTSHDLKDSRLPDVTSSNEGEVLMVVNGAWSVEELSFCTYYTGTSNPSSSLGNNGDLYLQIDE